MCRFVAYLGQEILMSEILVKPKNSLVKQSLHARESTVPTNGDGFGLAWYLPKISSDPALFTSILPAWNDQNLQHLTEKTKSACFFAHVRAASTGGVNQYNCHPFIHAQWSFMHNGCIANFIAVKRHLRRLLDDDIYNWIKGETDSEHFFALFLQLAKGKDFNHSEQVADTLKETIEFTNRLVAQHGQQGSKKQEVSYFNFCLSDGQRIFTTRYCSDPNTPAETLHYCSGQMASPHQKAKRTHGDNRKTDPSKRQSVLIASEKLTEFKGEWHMIPKNHLLIVEKNWDISTQLI